MPRTFLGLMAVVLAPAVIGCHPAGRTRATPATRPMANAGSDAEALVAEASVQADPRIPGARYFYLPATFQGRAVSLLLDTGTGFHLFFFQAALAQIGMPMPRTQHKQRDSLTITMGTRTEQHVPTAIGTYVFDTTHTPAGLPPLIGILGNFQLPRYDLVFDGPAGRVRLYHYAPSAQAWDTPHPSAAPSPRRAWLPAGVTPADCTPLPPPIHDNHTVFLAMGVNGHPVTAWFDSGDRLTEMNLAAAKLFGITKHTQNLQRSTDGGYVLHDFPLMLGTHHLVVPELYIGLASDTLPEIKFGFDAFQDQLLVIAYSSSQVCLGTPPITSAPGHRDAAADRAVRHPPLPGIPNRPDVVTVIPFVTKPHETAEEQTKVIIPAKVGNAYGNFVLDLGAPRFNLNRTFLQPSPTGEIDTITAAHRLPEGATEDSVHATILLGTLVDTVVEPTYTGPNPKHINAFLNHLWGNFSWVFAPRLGNIGTSVLEPFETIIDYTHQRVVLIRLDKAGHRLATVPAYTPQWTTRMLDIPRAHDARQWWGIAVRPDLTLDTAHAANNTLTRTMDTGAPENEDDLLGYPFLRQFGVVGFNHRTHQFIVYR